ncbi:MAG TPA: EamA family transporter [Candidatus Limnocylindria bacterium]|nr:EamA family transporter [Candidatus Limnocylindria bacterium]
MAWILFSLLAAFIWAGTNILDKYILSKWVKTPTLVLMGFGLACLIAAAGIYVFKGFAPMDWKVVVASLLSGIFYLLAELMYYKAAQVEEISRVISLIYLDGLFTAILSAIFLGEIFSPLKYLGVVLLVAGAIAISYKKSTGFKFTKAIWLCILGAVLYSFCSQFAKFSLNHSDYWTVFAYIRLGTFIALLPVYYSNFKTLKIFATQETKRFGILILNNAAVLVGALFFVIAASLGYLTLANALAATQPFFVLIMIVSLSLFYPHVLKEESNKVIVAQKVFAMVLMFIGVLLVT